MDQIRFGKFLAALRRREGLTQEALGKKLGVTNKTISRWENGNYMPDIEMIGLLAGIFGISTDELLNDAEQKNVKNRSPVKKNNAVLDSAMFSLAEKKAFYIRKWRRDHIALYVVLFIVAIASIMIPVLLHQTAWLALVPIVLFIEKGYLHNRMMIYVEDHLYGQNIEK